MDYETIVIGGGGVKILSFMGSLEYLENHHHLDKLKFYIGSSAGAIIVSLLAIGYTAKELKDFCLNFDFSLIEEKFSLDNVFNNKGINTGEKLQLILKKLIDRKYVDIDLINIYTLLKKKLIITTSCLTTKSVVYLDYKKYPNLKLWEAIMMSVSIPGYFVPFIYEGRQYVDGGVLDNFPIQLAPNIKKTIGLVVNSLKEQEKNESLSFYFWEVITCLYFGQVIGKIEKYRQNCICFSANNLNIVDFNLTKEKKIELFKYGYDITNEFYNSESVE